MKLLCKAIGDTRHLALVFILRFFFSYTPSGSVQCRIYRIQFNLVKSGLVEPDKSYKSELQILLQISSSATSANDTIIMKFTYIFLVLVVIVLVLVLTVFLWS